MRVKHRNTTGNKSNKSNIICLVEEGGTRRVDEVHIRSLYQHSAAIMPLSYGGSGLLFVNKPHVQQNNRVNKNNILDPGMLQRQSIRISLSFFVFHSVRRLNQR